MKKSLVLLSKNTCSTNWRHHHLIDSSFDISKSINLLTLLYNNITPDQKSALRNSSNVISDKIDDLKRCKRTDECSTRMLKLIEGLLTLEPAWREQIKLTPQDLHNAIINNNKVNVNYFLKYIQIKDEKDKIALAVISGDSPYFIEKTQDKNIPFANYGKEFGDSGKDITLFSFIIMHGTEAMINFMIDDLKIDINCYSTPTTINYNTSVSAEYNRYYNQRFEGRKCSMPSRAD